MPITRVPCTLPRSETREFVRITDLLDGQEDCSSSLDEQTSFVENLCEVNELQEDWCQRLLAPGIEKKIVDILPAPTDSSTSSSFNEKLAGTIGAASSVGGLILSVVGGILGYCFRKKMKLRVSRTQKGLIIAPSLSLHIREPTFVSEMRDSTNVNDWIKKTTAAGVGTELEEVISTST